MFIPTRTGTGSLGLIAPTHPPVVTVDKGYVALRIPRPAHRADRVASPGSPVLRSGEPTRDEEWVVDEVNDRIHAGVGVLIGIDVDLPYMSPENPTQWLQVSAIHLRDDPYWPGAQPGQPHALSVTWHGRPATNPWDSSRKAASGAG